jgi:hypothetical protein
MMNVWVCPNKWYPRGGDGNSPAQGVPVDLDGACTADWEVWMGVVVEHKQCVSTLLKEKKDE